MVIFTKVVVVYSSYMRSAILPLMACAAFAQTGFEAASVKRTADRWSPLRGGPGTSSPGQLSGVATLKVLVMRAYGLKDYQVSGPAWMDSERYEIAAKIPAGATRSQVSLMLQGLLADRFGLAIHRETRELPIFALLVGKNGPKLRASDPNAVT